MQLHTVCVSDGAGSFVRINESDFDPERHRLYVPPGETIEEVVQALVNTGVADPGPVGEFSTFVEAPAAAKPPIAPPAEFSVFVSKEPDPEADRILSRTAATVVDLVESCMSKDLLDRLEQRERARDKRVKILTAITIRRSTLGLIAKA